MQSISQQSPVMKTRDELCTALRTMRNLDDADIDAVSADKEFFQPYLRQALARRARLQCVSEEEEYGEIDCTDFHAIFLLTHLEDEFFVPDFLKCLQMDENTLEELYADSLTDVLWLPIERCGDGHWDAIWDFLISPDVDRWARDTVVNGVVAMALLNPSRREIALRFLTKLFKNEEIFDQEEIAFWFTECGDCGLIELQPLAEQLTERFALEFDEPDFPMFAEVRRDEILESFSKPMAHVAERYQKTTVYSIYAEWRKVEKEEEEYRKSEERREAMKAAKELPERQYYPSPAPKVERNDPCPCGSGKKYKKCCGK